MVGTPGNQEQELGVPLALVKTQARVGSPSGPPLRVLPRVVGLWPRAATALWPTGPGPGGIPLWRDLQSSLTRGDGTPLCQVALLAPIRLLIGKRQVFR